MTMVVFDAVDFFINKAEVQGCCTQEMQAVMEKMEGACISFALYKSEAHVTLLLRNGRILDSCVTHYRLTFICKLMVAPLITSPS